MNNKQSLRLYDTEGAIHVYSSLPTCIYPADLYLFKGNDNVQIKERLSDSNIYLISRRKRVTIDTSPLMWEFENGFFYGSFIIPNQEPIAFSFDVSKLHPNVQKAYINENEFNIVCLCDNQLNVISLAHIIAYSISELPDEYKKLEVLYIGQGIGKKNKKTAIDRLYNNHSTLQRIMAETITFYPQHEILLLLYNFEHRQIIMSNGGDLTIEPQKSDSENNIHFTNIQKALFTRKEVIDSVEASLINYFKPYYNILLKNTIFTAIKKIKSLEKIINKELIGIIVEISSANLQSKLWSQQIQAPNHEDIFCSDKINENNIDDEKTKLRFREEVNLIKYSHFIQHALTTSDQQNTFFHPMMWNR